MLSSFVCTLASVLALMNILSATPVTAPHSRLEKALVFDPLALGHASGQDDRSVTRSGNLQSRHPNQARTEDLISSREQTFASANSYSHARSVSHSEAGCSPSVSDRSLLADLATIGFRVIWDYVDISYASYIAVTQTTELWANITANARGKWKAEERLMTLDISYGCLKLSITGLIDTISWELVAEFAAEMLVLSRILVFGAFRVVLFASWAVLVITLAIAPRVLGTIRPQQLITGP